MVRIRHAQKDRGNDFYATPPEATRALIRAQQLPHGIWEPHCGMGALAEILLDAGHAVVATDVEHRGYQFQSGTFNFLTARKCPPGVDAIVMNPPYATAALHVQHALMLCPFVVALLRLSFLEAGNEKTELGRARLWCLDRGHLAKVLVFIQRLPMMHREGWEGPRSTNTVPFAWFVFDGDHKSPATIHRISWIDSSKDSEPK